jgi:hypothetical protein
MKTNRFRGMRNGLIATAMILHGTVGAATTTLFCAAEGDVSYAWNSKYGPYGYTQGADSIGVGLYMGAPYGNDYTMGIVEIPLAGLTALTLESAVLRAYSNGFSTGYYYGSAGMRWLDPGTVIPTGDPVADGMGPLLGSPSIEYLLWDGSQGAGWYEFDVTSHVLTDLNAGRNYSTFVLNGSRDTGGSIRTAEYGGGYGPQLEVTTVPETSTPLILLGGLLALLRRRKSA